MQELAKIYVHFLAISSGFCIIKRLSSYNNGRQHNLLASGPFFLNSQAIRVKLSVSGIVRCRISDTLTLFVLNIHSVLSRFGQNDKKPAIGINIQRGLRVAMHSNPNVDLPDLMCKGMRREK